MTVDWIDLPRGLGRVSPMNSNQVCDWLLADGDKRVMGNLNVHALYLCQTNEAVGALTREADAVIIDGWPILQLARRAAGSERRITADLRVGSSDWLDELLRRDPDALIVSIGGVAETAIGAVANVARRTRRLRWAAYDGFDFELRAKIRTQTESLKKSLAEADIVLVAMGMPTQEQWILDHRDEIAPGAAIANIGGCLDYLAGVQPLAPRWMGGLGLEWLFRLVRSPRRLAGRYLWEPLKLLRIVLNGETRRSSSDIKAQRRESKDR